MADVFISYSRLDKKFVQQIHEALRHQQRDAWVDWEDIQPSEEWWKAIELGIESADTFVAVLSPDYIRSPICYKEVEHAVKHHKRMIPVLCRDIPTKDAHPSLSAHNWIFMREGEDFQHAFQLLLKAIDTDLRHVKMHTRLIMRAVEWDREGRDRGFLLRDRDLEASEQWLKSSAGKEPSPTELQIQYLHASQELRRQIQEEEAAYQRVRQELQRAVIYQKPAPRTVLFASAAVTLLVLVARFLGLLQPLELAAYDQMMRLKPAEAKDDRFLIVEVTEQDIQDQINRGEQVSGSLSDATLAQLLSKLEPLNPRLIGLDIYRDPRADSPALAAQLRSDDRIFAVCKGGPDEAIPPPSNAEFPSERVALSDVVPDKDDVIRRHLLLQEPVVGSPCLAEYSLSFQLAKRYLELTSSKELLTSAENLQIGEKTFKWFQPFTGGYQAETVGGFQILLNYRNSKSNNAAEGNSSFDRLTLSEVLGNAVPAESYQDRIILIGVSAQSGNDYFPTPYGTGDQKMMGAELHAHMTSQLIHAALYNRPLIWVWSQGGEALWILGWSLIGGWVTWRFRTLRRLVAVVVVAAGGVLVLCFGFFTQAGWIPLVPPLLTLVGTSGLLVYLSFRRSSHLSKQTASVPEPPAAIPAKH